MDRLAHPAPTVAEAKQRLRQAASAIDSLAPVKRHPWQAAGAAFFAGFLLNRVGSHHFPPSLLALAVHLLKRL